MKITLVGPAADIAYIESEEPVITDVQSAIDLMATVRYDTGCDRMIVDKDVLAKGFFIPSTCLAGDVLQKYINYKMKIAIVGDYSSHTSKPLKDFMYESNRGKDIFFLSSMEEAIERLSGA